MKTEQAKRMLEVARAEAQRLGIAVSVAIVDAAGVPILLERIEGAPRLTTLIAEAKAYTAAVIGLDTSELHGVADQYPAAAAGLVARLQGRFLPLGGGVTLEVSGEPVGAIGISGGSEADDRQVAEAAAKALSAG